MSTLLRKVVGRLAAEVCYYIGHWSWLLFDAIYEVQCDCIEKMERMPWYLEALWCSYQSTMSWSWSAQDWGGCEKPWTKVSEEAV